MPFHPSEKEAAQECLGDDILSVLVEIQQHLNEAHALCDTIHGPIPRSKEQEDAKDSGGRLYLVEERVGSIKSDTSELLPRLRDILNRLGQVK